jgi:hypothetical protein
VSKKDAIEALLSNRHNEPLAPKKKVTFDFDQQLHKELKIFAVERNTKMVDIVVEAVKEYMHKRNGTPPNE